MPGIRVEKLTESNVISRPMRRATSVKRSIWKPSVPPPSFGMACGAKVPSTPVRSGGCLVCASAEPASSRTAAERRRNMAELPGRISVGILLCRTDRIDQRAENGAPFSEAGDDDFFAPAAGIEADGPQPVQRRDAHRAGEASVRAAARNHGVDGRADLR